MPQVVVLARAPPAARDKTVLLAHELGGEKGGEERVGVGEVGYGEVARAGRLGQVDFLLGQFTYLDVEER
jgi:hypothetical protein